MFLQSEEELSRILSFQLDNTDNRVAIGGGLDSPVPACLSLSVIMNEEKSIITQAMCFRSPPKP